VRRSIVPFEQVVYQAITAFLTPLQPMMPEAVQEAIVSLDNGYRPGPAGETFSRAFQSRLEEVNRQAEITANFYKEYHKLEEEIREKRERLRLKEKEIDDLNKKIKESQEMISNFQTTIKIQNRILAKQHEQIVNLCGMQGDSSPT
jgi:peptidoglycan hydrolase CwlO-like protein